MHSQLMLIAAFLAAAIAVLVLLSVWKEKQKG